jgi:hypothetical protein
MGLANVGSPDNPDTIGGKILLFNKDGDIGSGTDANGNGNFTMPFRTSNGTTYDGGSTFTVLWRTTPLHDVILHKDVTTPVPTTKRFNVEGFASNGDHVCPAEGFALGVAKVALTPSPAPLPNSFPDNLIWDAIIKHVHKEMRKFEDEANRVLANICQQPSDYDNSTTKASSIQPNCLHLMTNDGLDKLSRWKVN